MAVTKMQRVNSITHTVNYILRNDKTYPHLIFSHNCSPESLERNFKDTLDRYNISKGSERELKARMIIQSYDPEENITPEQAHEYGKEFARNYLKNEHEYILVTHHDAKHIHNHIVFNDVNYIDLKVFDSTRENTLHRMRNENDLVSERHGLRIIDKTRRKHNYLTHKDYIVRSKGISFKEKIENDIDLSIKKSNSFYDFLDDMKRKGYKVKQGRHLSFKTPSGKKFMRTKTLGFNYLENSIKYRIENKDYVPFKPRIITKEWIDKDQKKFRENRGLRKWATLQNINYLHEVNNVLSSGNISLNQFVKEKKAQDNLEENLNKKLSKLDNLIFKIENMSDCYDVYKRSYNLMIGFKKLESREERDQYKKDHFHDFKKYDTAKKNMNILKKGYLIHNEDQLDKKLNSLNEERELIYSSLNINRSKEMDLEQEMDNQQAQQGKKRNKSDLEL